MEIFINLLFKKISGILYIEIRKRRLYMSEDKTLYWMYADIDEVIDMDYREGGE